MGPSTRTVSLHIRQQVNKEGNGVTFHLRSLLIMCHFLHLRGFLEKQAIVESARGLITVNLIKLQKGAAKV